MTHDGCADRSAALGEPLGGTAVRTDAWLLVEEPGSWGERGLSESVVDGSVATDLQRRADHAGVRIQLIRQPDRLTSARRQVFLASSRPGATWMAGLTCDDDYARLGRLDLASLATAAEPPSSDGWEPVDGPVFLVCTHAKRDPCCAVYGRAAAAVLAATQRGRAWETSHTGGHRFAPNLVCLPHGAMFGRLDPQGIADTAQAYADGDVLPAGYRGRSAHDPHVQAAEVAVRERLGAAPVDAVRLLGVEGEDPVRTIHLATPEGRAEVEVERRATGTARLIGCHKTTPTDPGEHVVRRLTIEVRA